MFFAKQEVAGECSRSDSGPLVEFDHYLVTLQIAVRSPFYGLVGCIFQKTETAGERYRSGDGPLGEAHYYLFTLQRPVRAPLYLCWSEWSEAGGSGERSCISDGPLAEV